MWWAVVALAFSLNIGVPAPDFTVIREEIPHAYVDLRDGTIHMERDYPFEWYKGWVFSHELGHLYGAKYLKDHSEDVANQFAQCFGIDYPFAKVEVDCKALRQRLMDAYRP